MFLCILACATGEDREEEGGISEKKISACFYLYWHVQPEKTEKEKKEESVKTKLLLTLVVSGQVTA